MAEGVGGASMAEGVSEGRVAKGVKVGHWIEGWATENNVSKCSSH